MNEEQTIPKAPVFTWLYKTPLDEFIEEIKAFQRRFGEKAIIRAQIFEVKTIQNVKEKEKTN